MIAKFNNLKWFDKVVLIAILVKAVSLAIGPFVTSIPTGKLSMIQDYVLISTYLIITRKYKYGIDTNIFFKANNINVLRARFPQVLFTVIPLVWIIGPKEVSMELFVITSAIFIMTISMFKSSYASVALISIGIVPVLSTIYNVHIGMILGILIIIVSIIIYSFENKTDKT